MILITLTEPIHSVSCGSLMVICIRSYYKAINEQCSLSFCLFVYTFIFSYKGDTDIMMLYCNTLTPGPWPSFLVSDWLKLPWVSSVCHMSECHIANELTGNRTHPQETLLNVTYHNIQYLYNVSPLENISCKKKLDLSHIYAQFWLLRGLLSIYHPTRMSLVKLILIISVKHVQCHE